jgi:hypothetical protein
MAQFVCINGCGRAVAGSGQRCDVCDGERIVQEEMGNKPTHQSHSAERRRKIGEGVRKTKLRSKTEHHRKGKKAATTDKKNCVDCKKNFKPTSNVQKRCNDCGEKHKIKRIKKSNKKYRNKIHSKTKIKKVKHKPEPSPAGVPPDPNIIKAGDGKGLLGQLFYSQQLLDEQINSVLETNMIDTKTIFDIRFRLGEVLRGSVNI